MIYHVIGLMSGSSLDGLDIAYVQIEENAGVWQFEIRDAVCIPYTENWKKQLSAPAMLPAKDYLLLHTAYGQYLGHCVRNFLTEKNLEYRIQLIASHGHTAFHLPALGMTAQLGDGAAIASVTGIRTITDFRSLDVALGGQGAPVVPIGDKLLFPDFDLFLNLGGIANLSANQQPFIGFDVCPANRILDLLAAQKGKGYDENGQLASQGSTDGKLLEKLNAFEYYQQTFPKSLSNEFGLHVIYPAIADSGLSVEDALRTYTEHIVYQIAKSLRILILAIPEKNIFRLLVTGGGSHNKFLTGRLQEEVKSLGIECIIPHQNLADFKEALVIGLMGILRWRDEINVMCSVTGASRDSINGAVWSV